MFGFGIKHACWECGEIKLIKSAGGGGDLESKLWFDILVKEAESQDGEGGVAKIVHWDERLVQRRLQAKNVQKNKQGVNIYTFCC